ESVWVRGAVRQVRRSTRRAWWKGLRRWKVFDRPYAVLVAGPWDTFRGYVLLRLRGAPDCLGIGDGGDEDQYEDERRDKRRSSRCLLAGLGGLPVVDGGIHRLTHLTRYAGITDHTTNDARLMSMVTIVEDDSWV